MDKEQAQEILNLWLEKSYRFPVVEEVIKIYRMKTIEEIDFSFTYDPNEGVILEEYSFRELLKIAYDLKDK